MSDIDHVTALGQLAEAAGKTVDAVTGLGSYIKDILGDLPKDLVGLAIGDQIKAKRYLNADASARQSEEILRARNVRKEPVSLSIAGPLLDAAANESRPELQEIWAKLLAAAQDPARRDAVRQDVIDAVRKLEPVDTIVLNILFRRGGLLPAPEQRVLNEEIQDNILVEVALDNLVQLGIVFRNPVSFDLSTTAKGKLLIRAVEP